MKDGQVALSALGVIIACELAKDYGMPTGTVIDILTDYTNILKTLDEI